MGWYRFVGDAGTKMPTTRVPAFRCGTSWPGWLDSAHPTVKDGKVLKWVCFSDRSTGCRGKYLIYVKSCGSYFIYKLFSTSFCNSRYCGTDWIWSKCTSRSKSTHKSLHKYMFIRFLRCDVIDEDGEVQRTVCFSDRSTSCKCSMVIFVKNCGSHYIYKLHPPICISRYCGTDWMWSKDNKWEES